ncbi:MAG: transcriptional regulator [Alphaproteobacteria bacterium]|nr:transcriptional regulator [Alphaproteobacteria bacterium]
MGNKWTASRIKCEIEERGMNLSMLAVLNNLSTSSCRVALKKSYPSAEKAISNFLNVPVHELWPDRYECTHGDNSSLSSTNYTHSGMAA